MKKKIMKCLVGLRRIFSSTKLVLMNRDQIQARINATMAQIEAYEAAVLALASGGAQSYTIDTGQTRQTVTKFDIKQIQAVLDILYNRCATLEARLNGTGVTIVRPAF